MIPNPFVKRKPDKGTASGRGGVMNHARTKREGAADVHKGAALLVGMILVVVLAGCGGSSTPAVHKGPSNATLTIVANTVGDWPKIFNPYSSSSNTGAQGLIYETLLFYNRLDGSTKPWLATSQQLSSDNTVVTYHLRQGVKWTDGQPFTSDDVVFTLNLLKKYSAMDLNSIWSFIKDVSAPDAATVTVTLNKAFTPALWYIAGQTWILSRHHWSNVGDASQYADPSPVGTGPYVLNTFTPQLYTLAKNPGYWQAGKPEVAKLAFPAFDSNTSSELVLDRGNLDWAGLYVPDIQKTYISRDRAHNHYWFPTSDFVALYLNLTKYPFNLLPVRQAISAAIDRNQLYKIAESGYEPVSHPTGLLLPFDKSYLSPDYANTSFVQDLSQTDQLLQSVGFTKGSDGIYADKHGKKLSFAINVVTGYTDWITGCQIMASELKAAGMNVTINTQSYDTYFNNLQMGQYDVAIYSTNPGPSPYYIYDALLRSTNSAPVGQQASSNYERWMDPATDSLLNAYASTTDPTIQQQSMAGLQKIMVEQLPAIPLTNEPYWYEYSTTRFTGWPDQAHPYAVPSPYTYPDNEIVLLNLRPV